MKEEKAQSSKERIRANEVSIKHLIDSINRIEKQVTNHIPHQIEAVEERLNEHIDDIEERINNSIEKIEKKQKDFCKENKMINEKQNKKINESNKQLAIIIAIGLFIIPIISNFLQSKLF